MHTRRYSDTGYESIILRGIAGQKLFKSNEDSRYFKNLMYEVAKLLDIKLIAYAIMKNQVRLQLYTKEPYLLSEYVKRLCIRYVRHYFNPRYDRNGSLFQNRFINERMDKNNILKLNKELVNAFTGSGEGMVSENCSYTETLKGTSDTRLFTSAVLQGLSGKEYKKYITGTDKLSLPRLAYTPNVRQIKEYLNKACSEGFVKASEAVKRTVVSNLRRNKVSIITISRITGTSCYRLLKLC